MNSGLLDYRRRGFALHPVRLGFKDRMFFWLGGLVCGLGATGLAGAMGGAHAAEALAVLAGPIMLIVITAYARGRFAPALPDNACTGTGSADPPP